MRGSCARIAYPPPLIYYYTFKNAPLPMQEVQIKAGIHAAIILYQKKQCDNVRAAAVAFTVLALTLRSRLAEFFYRSHARESAQIPSHVEEQA